MVRDLTVGSPMKRLLTFSFPFVLANLLQQVYNMADMVIVGQFVGSAGLAAASAGGEMAVFFLFISMGFSSAGQIVISQHIGVGDRTKLGRTIGTLFTFQLIMSIAFTVLSLCICDWIIDVLNVPPEAVGYAHDYAFTYFCGTLPVFGYNVIGAILRGMGDSKRPFIFVAIAATLNIALDLLFVGPLGMACFGAALATIISQTVSFLVAVIHLYRHRDAFGFDFRLKSFAIDRRELGAIVRLGFPLAIQNAAISLSMLYINSFINEYGVIASAATAVGNKVTLVVTICTGAMSMAGNSIIAQNFAAGKFRRVSETLGCILIVCCAFWVVFSAVVMLFPETVFSFFDRNPDVLAMSHEFAPIMVISLLGFATRSAGFAFINGIGYARLSFVGGFMDGMVARIGLSLLFGVALGMGVRGFWLGSALAGHVISIIALVYYLSGRWKKRKLLV